MDVLVARDDSSFCFMSLSISSLNCCASFCFSAGVIALYSSLVMLCRISHRSKVRCCCGSLKIFLNSSIGSLLVDCGAALTPVLEEVEDASDEAVPCKFCRVDGLFDGLMLRPEELDIVEMLINYPLNKNKRIKKYANIVPARPSILWLDDRL